MGGTGVLNHVILHVRDMESEVSFYRDVMGFEVKMPEDVEDFADADWVELNTGECSLALHSGGRGRIGEDAPRLNFWVGDIEGVRERLIEKGVRIGEIRNIAPGVYVCDGQDPEGHRFSLEGTVRE